MKLSDLLPKNKIEPMVDPAKQKILLVAPPKFGKTTWCASFPDPLFLATEEGHDAVACKRISISGWDWVDEPPKDVEERMPVDERGIRSMKLMDALDVLKSAPGFRTLVVDTLDRLYLMVTDHICAKKGIDHPSDEGYAKAWHAVRDEFTRGVMRLTSLNRGIIFISHVRHKDIENTRTGSKITQAEATIPAACRAIIEPEVNIILHGGWARPDEDGKRERIWQCEPDESVRECGDRTGRLPPQFPCKKVGGYDVFASYFKSKK